MSNTRQVEMNGDFVAAAGSGFVTFAATSYTLFYVIMNQDADEQEIAGFSGGYRLLPFEEKSLSLDPGEVLHLKGHSGELISVNATTPMGD